MDNLEEAKKLIESYRDGRKAFWVGYIEGFKDFNGRRKDERLLDINPREEVDPFLREEARGYRLGVRGASFEEARAKEPLLLPARVGYVTHTLRFRQPEPPLDDRAKMLLRNKAKKLAPYSKAVLLEPDVCGRRDDGTPVPVTTLGQWLFGVPGFRGHITVVAKKDVMEVNLALPEDEEVRQIVLDLIRAAASKLGLDEI